MGEDGSASSSLDELTTDCTSPTLEQLLALLDRLVDTGTSGDRDRASPVGDGPRRLIIGPWPGAGHDGGKVVFEGTPADLRGKKSTLTGNTWRVLWRASFRAVRNRRQISRPLAVHRGQSPYGRGATRAGGAARSDDVGVIEVANV
jgi:hypothetical protein